MIESLYRFRSTKALLDGFHELENQEIYFASSKELNDPLEGFKDLFWKGDEILWANLLKHYLLCLMHTAIDAKLNGPEHAFAEDQSFVFSTAGSLPTLQFRELYQRICEVFFGREDIAQLPLALSRRNSPTRRNELTTYFRTFHVAALDAVLTGMEEYHLIPLRPENDPLRIASARFASGVGMVELYEGHFMSCRDMIELYNALELEHPEEPSITEAVFAEDNLIAIQSDLIRRCNGTLLGALQTIGCEFPTRYASQLEQLLYADWYAACFVEDPMQAAMWGNYGDEHRGVCLKFRAHPNETGKPSIRLRQINGWHAGESGSNPIYGQIEHEFSKVEYDSRFIDVDFFRSLGRLSQPMLDYWYKDSAGNISPYVSDIISDPVTWREQYWGNFTRATTTKLTDWAHENEYRLTIDSSVIDFREISARKLQYDFADLQGLIFGLKTSAEDKVEIIRVIAGKCRQAARNDFEFYQAYYSHVSGKMEMAGLSLLRFADASGSGELESH